LTCRAGLRSAAISTAGRDVSTAGRGVVTSRVLAGLTLPATRRRLGRGRALRVSAAARETSRNGHQGEHCPEPETSSLLFHLSVHLSKEKLSLPRG
jgi:hypothetical protein